MQMNIPSSIGALVLALLLPGCQTPGQARSEIKLFNQKDLTGWTFVSADPQAKREGTWSIDKGILSCTGIPVGFIHTARQFTNFRLVVEYRWAPGAKPGNSGIFSRINDPSRALPRCVECQLMAGSAGDILTLQGMGFAAGQERFFEVKNHELGGDIRGVRKAQAAESATGEWNRVEILADGATYTVWLNGTQVNSASGIEVKSGFIGLQSEGGAVQFRQVTLTPLP